MLYTFRMAKRRGKKSEKNEIEPPTSDCLLLCDDVLASKRTGKHNLIGVIGTIVTPKLPHEIGGYVAYIRFANVYSGQKIVLTFKPASDEASPLFQIEFETPNNSNPLSIATLQFKIPMFVVECDGRYKFQAEHAGVPFVSTTIMIRSIERKEPDENAYD